VEPVAHEALDSELRGAWHDKEGIHRELRGVEVAKLLGSSRWIQSDEALYNELMKEWQCETTTTCLKKDNIYVEPGTAP
jgi:hypothetical protein